MPPAAKTSKSPAAASGAGSARVATRAPKAAAARVPRTRLGRLAGIALAAGEFAAAGVVEGVRRFVGGAAGAAAERGPIAAALLTAERARRLAEHLARLRGGAMKLGQMLSLQGADLLPPEFAQALERLRSQAAPMPTRQLRAVLGRELGAGWRQRFARFDEEPIAAASIGQVHRARATDGRELALKIQYPGVARSIRGDVANLAALLRLLDLLPGTDVDALAAEAARQLGQEADYLAEADAIERFATLVADEPGLAVPSVHRDLTTTRVLAMDYMPGEPLETLAEPGVAQSTRDAVGSLLERLMFRELFEFRTMQTDPNFANYLWQPDTGKVVLLDFGATTRFEAGFVDAYARISRALLEDDREQVVREAIGLGYAREDDPPELVGAAADLITLVCEPLRHAGRYDFAASDLPARGRELGFELGFRKRLLRAPPPQTIFLHRKLVGSYLLLARIGARVDARALALPLIERRLGPVSSPRPRSRRSS